MFIRAVRRSGHRFPEKGWILEHQIFRFAKIILRDRCSTSYDLASLFRGRRSTLDRWSGKIAKRIGTRPSALHSNFHFWRKSRRMASFLMLSTWKIEEVSQNCFVFDVIKVMRFWRCHVQKLRKSRRKASFSSLQIDRQTDGRTGRQTRTDGRGQDRTGQDRTGQTDRYTDRWMDAWIDRYIMDKQKDK